jgi:hypothetical protein
VQVLREVPLGDSGLELDGENAFSLTLIGGNVAALGAGGRGVEGKVVESLEKAIDSE